MAIGKAILPSKIRKSETAVSGLAFLPAGIRHDIQELQEEAGQDDDAHQPADDLSELLPLSGGDRLPGPGGGFGGGGQGAGDLGSLRAAGSRRPLRVPAAVRTPVQASGLAAALFDEVLRMEEGILVVALTDLLHPHHRAVSPYPVPLGEGKGTAAGAEIVGIEVVDPAAVLAFYSPHGTILSLRPGAITGNVYSLRAV